MHTVTVNSVLASKYLQEVLIVISFEEWFRFSSARHDLGEPQMCWIDIKMLSNLL